VKVSLLQIGGGAAIEGVKHGDFVFSTGAKMVMVALL